MMDQLFKVYDKRDGKPVDMESLSQNQNSKGWWGYDLAWYRIHKLSWVVEEDGTLGLCDSNGNVRYPDHDYYYPVFNNHLAKAEERERILGIVEEMSEYNIAGGNDEYSLGTLHGWDSALLELKTRLEANNG